MLIVVEGERRSGKSTLISTLKMAIPRARVVHCTAQTPNDFRFFSDIIKAAYTETIICDRFCYGQFAYQSESERALSLESLHRLEVLMLECDTSVIYCDCDAETIVKRMDETGKNSCNGDYVDSVPRILKGFESIFSQSILPVVRYNTGNKNREDV